MASIQSRRSSAPQYDSDDEDNSPSNRNSDLIPYSGENNADDSEFLYATVTKGLYAKNRGQGAARTEGWWTIGAASKGHGVPLTHQSARLSMTGNRVYTSRRDDLWDLTDSVMELYENEHRMESTLMLHLGQRSRPVDFDLRASSIEEWIASDTSNGFLRVYRPDMSNFTNSQLIPCSLNTPVQKICLQLGISENSLHVQFHGNVIQRLNPHELPLVLQNDYLANLGYTNIVRIQEEGYKEELAYLVKFYSGKPMHDSTFSSSQLKAFINIKKGGILQQWVQRLCIISGTRLLIYKDKLKCDEPSVVQLARGCVEEVKLKGHELCLKLTATLQGDRQIFLSFTSQDEYNKWLRKCKKATDKLPTTADLSNCHLEYLPENVFINDQLAMLNLQHNVLKQRPVVDEDLDMIGWIEDLNRFSCLRSLNLADNHLESFPLSLCSITTLVELNLANNQLLEIPPEIQLLTNLQALHMHNNHLTMLPDQMTQLRRLFILVLAFNRFASLPPVVAQMTNVRYSEVENIIMAGNQIEKISSETLMEMKYVKKLDLRLNQLVLPTTETMKFTILEHLTHLDIRDNQVTELDIRAIKTLEFLNCERNAMASLQLNGTALKFLFAGSNCLERLQINPKPEWLLQIDVADNCLESLPDWLSDCFFLQKINASKNFLHELPSHIFFDAKKLKCLRVNQNQLMALPTEIGNLFLEELQIQNNFLTHLPPDLLQKANKLRILNATKNRLTQLPAVNENQDLNKVQELYLSRNHLGNKVMEVIAGYPRLKILHLAQNELTELYDSEIQRLELLQELNVSANQLQSLPDALSGLSKLVVLRAHSNYLNTLPDLHNAKSLRVLDVGHNQLFNVSVTNLMASQLNLLDMSLNTQLKVDPREFKTVKNKKSVCLVDLSGQNRRLPGLPQRNHLSSFEDALSSSADANIPWKVGFSETSGVRNKLCIAMIKQLKFGSENESFFGMFDGGRNNEVPKVLVEIMGDIVREEMSHDQTSKSYMKYALLTAHRKLKLSGQRLGATAVICHLERHEASNQMNHFTLSIANVGDTEAVLCHRGEAVVLTRKFTTTAEREECQRIYKSDGIITEDCKVNGTTHNTRLLGCFYLSPHLIPNPFTATIALRNDDEFIIIANGVFWEHVSYDEAVEEIYEIGNPIVAAKHLQDLAQGYGARENIAILVIRLNTDQGPSLGRLRPVNREMSIDDVEAAMQHEALKAKRAARVGRKPSRVKPTPDEKVSYSRDFASAAAAKMSSGAKSKSAQLLSFKPQSSSQQQLPQSQLPVAEGTRNKNSSDGSASGSTTLSSRYDESQNMEDYIKNTVEIEKPSDMWKKSGPMSTFASAGTAADETAGRQAPRQRFVKKNDWDTMKRAPPGIKDEVQLPPALPVSSPSVAASLGRNSILAGKFFMSGSGIALPCEETPDSILFPKSSVAVAPGKSTDAFSPNPAYSYIPDIKEAEVISMMARSSSQMKLRGSIASAVAMFESAKQPQTHPEEFHHSSAHKSLSPPSQRSGSNEYKAPRMPSTDGSTMASPRDYALQQMYSSRDSINLYPAPVQSAHEVRLNSRTPRQLNALNGSVEANLYQKVAKVGVHPLGALGKEEPFQNMPTNSSTVFSEMEVLEDGQTRVIEIARL